MGKKAKGSKMENMPLSYLESMRGEAMKEGEG
jgi:hypothetical protein